MRGVYQASGNKRHDGFTLVELILVAVLMSVIGLSLYSVFSNGIRIWTRVQQQSPQEDVHLALEMLTGELRNSFPFSTIPFLGSKDELQFATRIRYTDKRGVSEGIGQVRYRFSKSAEALIKEEFDYSQLAKQRKGKSRTVLKHLEEFQCSYYLYDPEERECFWAPFSYDSLEGESAMSLVPLAVRIEGIIDTNEQQWAFRKTITLPLGLYGIQATIDEVVHDE